MTAQAVRCIHVRTHAHVDTHYTRHTGEGEGIVKHDIEQQEVPGELIRLAVHHVKLRPPATQPSVDECEGNTISCAHKCTRTCSGREGCL